MKDRATTNTVNGNAVDEIGFSNCLPSTHSAVEKTKSIGFDSREAEPSNIDTNIAGLIHWQQCYGDLWKIKISFDKKHNR